jgi:transposase-like protein
MWADERLDGQLDALLLSLRAEGLSIDGITRALWERDIEVSRETVRRWVAEATR